MFGWHLVCSTIKMLKRLSNFEISKSSSEDCRFRCLSILSLSSRLSLWSLVSAFSVFPCWLLSPTEIKQNSITFRNFKFRSMLRSAFSMIFIQLLGDRVFLVLTHESVITDSSSLILPHRVLLESSSLSFPHRLFRVFSSSCHLVVFEDRFSSLFCLCDFVALFG